jgi:hypothetical protein
MTPVPHAAVMLRLLQGAIEFDDTSTWRQLLHYEKAIRHDFARLGLELVLHEADGYGFLRQVEIEDETGTTQSLPRLIARHKLNREVTLLCVLLRERLEQFESRADLSDKLILHTEEIHEMLRPFVAERSDERSLLKKFDTTIKEVQRYGFLKKLEDASRFEVRNLIKARIGAEQLLELKERLLNAVSSEASES